MRGRFLALLLIASVLFQSMASAGQGVMRHIADGLEHALMHVEKTPHHHHDGGTLHEDESDASLRHLQADNALNLFGLPSLAVPLLQEPVLLIVPSPHRSEAPPPVLDGPTRPPRPAG